MSAYGVHYYGSKQSFISTIWRKSRLVPCSIPSKKLSTLSMSCPTKMPTNPLTLLLNAPIIWPTKLSNPFVDYCSVNNETTPFWKDEITAQGDIDRCESKLITIFLMG